MAVIEATFRPLSAWPYPKTPWARQRGPRTFTAPWPKTLDLLDREIRGLRGSRVIIAGGFQERDLRVDGWPKERSYPTFPGVEISFDSKHGRLVYATDVCEFWQHNVRSIALGLGSLRAVDRFGVSSRGEQYAGWKALPGIALSSGVSDNETAWRILREAADVSAGDSTSLEDVFRTAAKRTHPDTGGNAQEFARVKAAYDWLKASAA